MPKRKDKSFELMASIGQAKGTQINTTIDTHEVEPTQTLKVEPKTPTTPKQSQPQASSKPPKNATRSNIPYIPPSQAVRKQLKRLAFEEETSMTALITEGIDHVFRKRGLKAIDQLMD